MRVGTLWSGRGEGGGGRGGFGGGGSETECFGDGRREDGGDALEGRGAREGFGEAQTEAVEIDEREEEEEELL